MARVCQHFGRLVVRAGGGPAARRIRLLPAPLPPRRGNLGPVNALLTIAWSYTAVNDAPPHPIATRFAQIMAAL
ncbi:MAG: hypothetical protein M0Z28_22450, partial [Rhodospirillales bacterium]|nr:hypothetical protein [Rhodospirillales bacterium]